MSRRFDQHLDVYDVRVLGEVQSRLEDPREAPLQADEGAPEAWLVFAPAAAPALDGLPVGEEILVITWLHLADRQVLHVHPRVFGTRSPHCPNPIGLHRTRILEITGARVRVENLEAVAGTPILDIKVALGEDDR